MARVALVSGGTRGIGAAISEALLKSEYKVAVTYAGNDAVPAREPGPMIPSAGAALDPAAASLPQGARTEAIPAPEALDRALHAVAAGLTGGLSPAAISLAFADWLLHLAISPGKQMALVVEGLQTTPRLVQQAAQPAALFQPWRLHRRHQATAVFLRRTGPCSRSI
jgi:NAD(P)-dependent dehydrogenase (short-subunit alcohol dehydrogenase family)